MKNIMHKRIEKGKSNARNEKKKERKVIIKELR